MGAPPKEEQGERVQRSPNQQMKKWNSISLCGVEWNGWICGLWGGAHLRHTTSLQTNQWLLFRFGCSALFLSFAVTQEEDEPTLQLNSSLLFNSIIFYLLMNVKSERKRKWDEGRWGWKHITNHRGIWAARPIKRANSTNQLNFLSFTQQKRKVNFLFYLIQEKKSFDLFCWMG